MRWSAVLKEFRDNKGIVCPQHSQEHIAIPIEYLPKGCRVGDVLQFNVSFDPFSTILLINESDTQDN
ncbi:MAG: hypothetical protein WBI74_07805 [Caldicoprobacterales bacterium]|jgi:hypothetical protein|nr:hypothetical protein [Clostridiales bacterium]